MPTGKAPGCVVRFAGSGFWRQGASRGTWSQQAQVHAVRALHAVCLCSTPSPSPACAVCVWACASVPFAWHRSLSGAPRGRGRLLDFKEFGQGGGGRAQALLWGFLRVLRPLAQSIAGDLLWDVGSALLSGSVLQTRLLWALHSCYKTVLGLGLWESV